MGERAKRAVKAVAAKALQSSGAAGLLRGIARVRAGGRRILILSYHRVVEDFDAEAKRAIPGMLVSGRTLAGHVEVLRSSGYELVSLAEALEVNAGLRRARRDLAVVTFDDGYLDVGEVGLPVLKRLGVPATVYLPTAYIGTGERLPHDRLFHLLSELRARRAARPNRVENRLAEDDWGRVLGLAPADGVDFALGRFSYAEVQARIAELEQQLSVDSRAGAAPLLDWAQCRAMLRDGVTFGAHTVRHAALHLEPARAAEEELRRSKEAVEANLGQPCRDFAFPNGYYSKPILRRLAGLGFRSAVTTEDTLNKLGGNPLTLKRKTIWENHSMGPDGFNADLLRCHVDSVFGMVGLSRPTVGERPAPGEARA